MTRASGLWRYFILTFLLSWGSWVPAALLGQTSTEFPTILLFLLGGFGPSIAGIWLTYRQADHSERRDLWRRLSDARRIGPGWYIVIIAFFPVIFALTYGINALVGGTTPGMDALKQVAVQPLVLISLVISGIVAGPLSEELGWRGFALDRLQARWTTWKANLLLGALWWAWHLPLFFIRGTTQHKFGVGTLPFWLFLINIFPLTFLITRVYNANRRSLLSAVMLHFFFNFTLGLVFPIPVAYNVIQVALSIVAVGILLIVAPANSASRTQP